MSSGPIYNAVRASHSTGVHQVSPTQSTFSGSTLSKGDLQDATRHRKGFAIFTSVLFGIATIFLLVLQVGNTTNFHVVGDLWMFKIDVSNIIPATKAAAAGAKVQNTTARAIGLHDFYQVGLWNFCEGYNDVGITGCSNPSMMFWFNPVQIIQDELLAGATGMSSESETLTIANTSTVALPAEVTSYLTVLQKASHVMFAMFFATTISSFILIFLTPTSVYSKASSIPVALLAFFTGLATLVGAGISAGIWTILRNQIKAYASDINIVPSIGTKMMIFAFVAAGCTLIGGFGQLGLTCCGTSRRDVKTGRRVGRRQRSQQEKYIAPLEENPALRRRWWGSVSH